MDINDVYAGKSLKAADLKGQEVGVTIQGYKVVEYDDGKKIVLSFQESDQTFVCNKTNAKTIADMLGTDLDMWSGQQITIFPTQTDFQRKQVACIRVKLKPVASATDEVQQLPGTPRRPPTDGFTETPF
tara:strand:- start:1 stop:387 length:387 start_codon:yes stop_codon:yes gene_type:complete